MPAQTHRSDPRILARRTLEQDQRCLAELLRPGLAVLDVGCGTGSITVGVARAVGAAGHVVGVDRDQVLLEVARKEHASVPNLRFERGDATALRFCCEFDIVAASRILQWITEPTRALESMKLAAKQGGTVVALDYNHSRNHWKPEPPPAFKVIYDAFLAWRQANGWDNEMADHLPGLFRAAGLENVVNHPKDEIVSRGEPGFTERSFLWTGTMQHVGEQVIAGGFCTKAQLAEGLTEYEAWVRTELTTQTLSMAAVVGLVPSESD